jgi:hypothetical protein
MHTYTPRTFALGTLEGLSEEQVKVHLGLYEGYVKHVNVLREQIAELTLLDKEKVRVRHHGNSAPSWL